MYSDTYSDKESRKLIYVAYNMHWENYALALPKIEGRNGFEVVLKSCDKRKIYILMVKREKLLCLQGAWRFLIGEYPERKTTMDVKKKASKNKK